MGLSEAYHEGHRRIFHAFDTQTQMTPRTHVLSQNVAVAAGRLKFRTQVHIFPMEISPFPSAGRPARPPPELLKSLRRPQNLDLPSKDFNHLKRKLTSVLSPETAPDNFIFKKKIGGRTRAHILFFKIKLRARKIRPFGRGGARTSGFVARATLF